MSETLERLYERRRDLVRLIEAHGYMNSNADPSVLAQADAIVKKAEKELMQVQALIDAAQS